MYFDFDVVAQKSLLDPNSNLVPRMMISKNFTISPFDVSRLPSFLKFLFVRWIMCCSCVDGNIIRNRSSREIVSYDNE